VLTSVLGIRLLLWAGKTIPTPVSPDLLLAIQQIEVTNNSQGDDGFQMVFGLTKQKTGEYDILQSGALDPDSRVIIGAIMGVAPEPLIDGVIYHHQLAPGSEPGTATLSVTGRDVRVMLDLKEVNAQYKNQPDSVIALQLIGRYAQYGLVPMITPTTNIPIELQQIPRQHETDLEMLNRMAARNGFVFYVEPLTIGSNTAYWGPVKRAGLPQPALTHDLGAASNVQDIHFTNDALSPEGAEGKFTEPITKQSIAIPPLPDLRVPPLAAQPTAARRTRLMRQTANRNPGQAATDLVARITNAPDAVSCTGRLDSVRYGGVLRARRLVGLRGAGRSYDGMYYVSQVKHVFTRTSYTQQFTLKREGTGALLPVVLP
jgi:hypothetical protein